ARAGIPDHLDRSPLNSIRTAASSGPLTAAWHARPLAAPAELSNTSGIDALLQGARGDCGADLSVPARRHPPRCRRTPATCPTTRYSRSSTCSSPWASRSRSPSSTPPPPPGGSGPSSPQPPSATSGRRAAPSFLAVPPADPRVPGLGACHDLGALVRSQPRLPATERGVGSVDGRSGNGREPADLGFRGGRLG